MGGVGECWPALPRPLPCNMEPGEDMAAYKARVITTHIGECLAAYTGRRPMIVGMQGPQGSGKTTTTEQVRERLEKTGSQVAVFSLDGAYQGAGM